MSGYSFAASPGPKAGERKIRVLIVDGFSNHDWPQTTALLRGILESAPKSGNAFDVSVTTAPQEVGSAAWSAWRPRFAGYDVVIQTCNDNAPNGLLEGVTRKPLWPDPVKKDFVDFVRKGGGVYIFHAAENAFVGWREYERMVGLSWRDSDYGTAIRVNEDATLLRILPGNPPGEPGSTGHGERGNVLVARIGEDPIHAGMPRTWLTPDLEVYYFARGPAGNLQVLAYGRDSKPGQGWLWPVEWTTTYGKGRVYVSTYGHVWPGDVQPAGMRCAAVQTILQRAVQWLARRAVTIPVPADFPGASTVSVRALVRPPK